MTRRLTAPTANRRQFWRAARQMLALLEWQVRMLAVLGVLSRPGRMSRWAKRRCGEIEHFLRCILVIALSARPGMQPTQAAQGSPRLSGSSIDPDDRQDAPFAPTHRRMKLGLSLARLGYAGPAPTIDGRKVQRFKPSDAKTPGPCAHDPSERLVAMADVLANPDLHLARLARRMKRLGLGLRRACAERPDGAGRVQVYDIITVAVRGLTLPAICDSS